MNKITSLIRPDLLDATPYKVPEEPQNYVRLNVNESPYDEFNRYPHPRPASLMKQVAEYYQTEPENVLLTRGSDDAIDLLLRLFCRPAIDNVIITPPTFSMYNVYARIQNAEVISVPLTTDNFSLDKQKLLTAKNDRTKILFLCSPNNPTGNSIATNLLVEIVTSCPNNIVVVDEAYIEFSEQQSLCSVVNQFDNLVILRTFSKAHALAGVRCGAIVANKELINLLLKVYPPFPFTTHTLQQVTQCLTAERLATTSARVKEAIKERKLLSQFLTTQNYVLKVWPSDSNFILFQVDNGDTFYQYCYKNGFILKSFNTELLPNCLRISVGNPEQNRQFQQIANNYQGANHD